MLIQRDLTWKVYFSDHFVPMENRVLAEYNSTITSETIISLISTLNNAFLCPGNVDSQIIQLAQDREGKFLSQYGQLIATLEKNVLLNVDNKQYFATVRHINCEILMSSLAICSVCQRYRNILRAMASRANML